MGQSLEGRVGHGKDSVSLSEMEVGAEAAGCLPFAFPAGHPGLDYIFTHSLPCCVAR